MNAPQLVEAALAGSHSDGCVVLVEACSEVNVRWARCSMTTNGAHRGSTMTVIGVRERAGGHRVGIASGSVTSEADALAVVHRADQAARASPPAEDASPLVAPYVVDDDWDQPFPRQVPPCSKVWSAHWRGRSPAGETRIATCSGSPSTG